MNVAGECYTSREVCLQVLYACDGVALGTSDVFSLQLSGPFTCVRYAPTPNPQKATGQGAH